MVFFRQCGGVAVCFVSSTVGLSMQIVSSYYLMSAVPSTIASMQCLCFEAHVVFSIQVRILIGKLISESA